MQKIKDFIKAREDGLRVAGWVILLLTVCGLFAWGLASLLIYTREENDKNCSKAAKTLQATDWITSGSSCFMVKDGKIAEIE